MADNQGASRAERVNADESIPPMISRNKSLRRKGGLSATSPIRGNRASVPDARLGEQTGHLSSTIVRNYLITCHSLIGDEVHVLASNTAFLGSTQLSTLCQGDYCSYKLTGPVCIGMLMEPR